MTSTTRSTRSSGVLYALGCAAPPVRRAEVLVHLAQDRGWDVCLILTPTAYRWLAAEDRVEKLQQQTGHPVRYQYKLPTEPDVLPPPDALLVAPATFNTLNKWALGIADSLVLGLLTEAIGKRLPLVALPHLNNAQAAHLALGRSITELRQQGVAVLLGPDGYEPHPPGHGRADGFPWQVALDALER